MTVLTDWQKAGTLAQADPAAAARIKESVTAEIDKIRRRNDIAPADVARGVNNALSVFLAEVPDEQRAALIVEVQQMLLRQTSVAANDRNHAL